MIHVASPDLTGRESEYVNRCLDSTWISSAGEFITRFEEMFASICGTKYAIATNNGTTALHLALVAAGIGPGDEVIVPTLTYIASANAVRYTGATPVFVDVVESSMCLDPDDVAAKITERTKAIMPVHLYGTPADMVALTKLASDRGVMIIEDAAEAHGATVNGKPVGAHGAMGVFSFFGNKIVTTGEGGAVLTDDDQLAHRLRILRGQGMDPERRYWFPYVGFNYRMTNIQAAIGVAQLERFDDMVARRAAQESLYVDRLRAVDGIVLPQTAPGTTRVNWLFTVRLEGLTAEQRNDVIDIMVKNDIETRPVFYPLTQMPPYFDDSGSFPVADKLGREGISLPTHLDLTEADIEQVCATLIAATDTVRGRV